uniref:Uncharacterized protein n=1 Tax=Anopheles maculatus TaxID=74869 RepID=A0A182SX19_9DIPT
VFFIAGRVFRAAGLTHRTYTICIGWFYVIIIHWTTSKTLTLPIMATSRNTIPKSHQAEDINVAPGSKRLCTHPEAKWEEIIKGFSLEAGWTISQR